jgi:hypothetical protein
MDEAKITCAVQAMLAPRYQYDGYSQGFAKNVSAFHLCAKLGLEGTTAKILDYRLALYTIAKPDLTKCWFCC